MYTYDNFEIIENIEFDGDQKYKDGYWITCVIHFGKHSVLSGQSRFKKLEWVATEKKALIRLDEIKEEFKSHD